MKINLKIQLIILWCHLILMTLFGLLLMMKTPYEDIFSFVPEAIMLLIGIYAFTKYDKQIAFAFVIFYGGQWIHEISRVSTHLTSFNSSLISYTFILKFIFLIFMAYNLSKLGNEM